MPKPRATRFVPVAAVIAAGVLLLLPGGTLLYEASGGESCTRCHEIRPSFDLWAASTHRSVACKECHGGVLTLDPGFHAGNLRRLVSHARDEVPQQVLLVRWKDVERVTATCARCHQQEHAAWKAGPHSATYADLFLDPEHNRKRLLMDDCLRCHGMHFQGSIGDLVGPVDTKGPWRLKIPELADKPAMPCIACHEVHRRGEPLAPRQRKIVRLAAGEEISRPSLALFDRRAQLHLGTAGMPVPQVLEGERVVRMSPDRRQALCYQCHAPLANAQAGSGDDRTGLGVHEGLSCLACHSAHNQTTRASCSGCHPRLSNCGLDVETMDTTFKDPKSPHNIHTVKCAGCHPKGTPPARRASKLAG